MSATATKKSGGFELLDLNVQTKGEVIASNANEFREAVRAALSTINREPGTDQEFEDAEQNVKALKKAETCVKDAKEKALADAEELQLLFATLDETSEEIRLARLGITRAIKARKEEVKSSLVRLCLESIDHESAKFWQSRVEDSIKGKRTIESIEKALHGEAAAINGELDECRAQLDKFEASHGREMILDRAGLETKKPDALTAELQRRLDLKKAEDEKKAAREAEAKAKAEADELRAKAEEAKKEIAQAAKPDAPEPRQVPKIGSIPVGNAKPSIPSETREEEMKRFIAIVREAFGPVKAARAALRHPENIKAAEAFADALKSGWEKLNHKPNQ